MAKRYAAVAAKTERLDARITPEQKSLIQRAAALTGQSVTDFVIVSAQENATRTVREHEIIALSTRDQEVFINALLNPPAPGPRLRKAAQRYKERVALDES
ncbi:MAG: DUF1778 domain-containing protein [Candidatus Binatia bacterium]